MPRAAFHRRALSLTSLVDVIFLLLLFFMFTSTFSRYSEVELAAATAGGAAQSGDTKFLQLGASYVRLAGRDVAMTGLPDLLTGAQVLVSLDGDVEAQRLIDLLGVLRLVPRISVTVLR